MSKYSLEQTSQYLDYLKARVSLNLTNVASVALALCWLLLVYLTMDPAVDDFKQYWQASRDLLRTNNPYASTPDWSHPAVQRAAKMGTLQAISYPYPPLLAMLIQPLGLLDYWQARQLWFVLNSLALVGLVVLCIRTVGSSFIKQHWGVALLIMAVIPASRMSLQLGQLSIFLALILTASLVLSTNRRWAGAGSLLALASVLKLYPALLGMYYLHMRLLRTAWWGIVAGLALLGLPVLLYGIAPYTAYVQKILLGDFYPYAAEFNISLLGFWQRLFTTSRFTIPIADLPWLALWLSLLSSLAVLGLCLWSGRGKPSYLQASMWLCAMLLLSPISGYYNLVLLLLPLLAMIRHLSQQPHRGMWLWLVAGSLLCCIPPTWTRIHSQLYNALHIGWGLLFLTPALYGLLIYLALLFKLSRSEDSGALAGGEETVPAQNRTIGASH